MQNNIPYQCCVLLIQSWNVPFAFVEKAEHYYELNSW